MSSSARAHPFWIWTAEIKTMPNLVQHVSRASLSTCHRKHDQRRSEEEAQSTHTKGQQQLLQQLPWRFVAVCDHLCETHEHQMTYKQQR